MQLLHLVLLAFSNNYSICELEIIHKRRPQSGGEGALSSVNKGRALQM